MTQPQTHSDPIRQQLLKLSTTLDSARQNGLTDEALDQLNRDAKELQRLVRRP